jgi:hypothetical protein
MKDTWIRIEDQQPEKDQKVLGYRPFAKELGDDEITVLNYTGYNSFDHKGRPHRFERCHVVTHWQHLISPIQ